MMTERDIALVERMLGLEPGKGVPAPFLEAYDRTRLACCRIQQNAPFTPRELVFIATAAGILPPVPGSEAALAQDAQKKAG